MDLNCLLQCMNLLYFVWLASFPQKVENIPIFTTEAYISGVAKSSTSIDHLKYNSDANNETKFGLFNRSTIKLKDSTTETVVPAEILYPYPKEEKNLRINLSSTFVVPYLCDIEKGMCWLNQDHENLVTFLVPIKLLPNNQPPSEMGLKEFYSLGSKNKKLQQMDNFAWSDLNSSDKARGFIPDAHPRRKRDTQYAEDNYNPQQEYPNQEGLEYEAEQSQRVQRNVPSTSTEQLSTSTEGRTQRSTDLQPNKQSKRAAENDDDDSEDENYGSPSPDDDYQEDSNEMDYHPEKRFAGPETTGPPPKPGETSSRNQSQLTRRAALKHRFNYPYFANPDFYYPSQRMLSPFDGLSYRSVDALPMMYMDPNVAFWQAKFVRSPQSYYQQRQSPGYGRGWPPMQSYYQPYGNRYQPPSQQSRGHYHRQQQSYRPYSSNYGQGNRNRQSQIKPVETDANMYYGK